MATTTTITITNDNVYYSGPNEASGEVSVAATVSGANDTLIISESGATDVNDLILYTGSNGHIEEHGFYGEIMGQGASGSNGLFVYGAADTIYATGANDELVSVGQVYTPTSESNDTVSGSSHTVTSTQTYVVGNHLYGQAGDDAIYFSTADTVYGGAGNDYIYLEYTISAADYANDGVTQNNLGAFVSGDNGDNTIDVTSSLGYDTVFGGVGNDVITAGISGLEKLYGQTGDDTITATGGNDYVVYGGAGNDHIAIGGLGSNFVSGDNGDDVITVGSNNDYTEYNTIYGGAGNDVITIISGDNGDAYGNVVYGGDGNDHIVISGAGYNFVSGDAGNDLIDLSGVANDFTGQNTVYGGTGDDTIYGSNGDYDQLYGQAGNDTIYLNGDYGTIYGGAGNDLLSDNKHYASFISGDNGDDSIFANGANDTIYGGDGNDSILATGANDHLYGQAGNDIITFNAGADTTGAAISEDATIFGGAGNDFITVSFSTMEATGTTTLNGGGSNDLYDPYTGAPIGQNDVVSYSHAVANDGVGHHFLSGDLGNDTIIGGSGGDTFIGGAGSDVLTSHRLEASGNDPGAYGYAANGSGSAAGAETTATNPNADTVGSANDQAQHSPLPANPTANAAEADVFIFHSNDSVGTSPVSPGTGSDISTGGGEAGIDHVHGFLLNVTGQEAIFTNGSNVAAQSFVNSQTGDDLVFLTGAHTTFGSGNDTTDATLDTNVFYGTVNNVLTGSSTATEQSDYAVAYAYAFGTGGTAAAPTSGAHFAAAVDFIVVDVYDTTDATANPGQVTGSNTATNNGNVFVFDHNGNAVALDGTALASTGTTGTFQNSSSPSGGLVDGTDALGQPLSVTTINIYH